MMKLNLLAIVLCIAVLQHSSQEKCKKRK